MIFCWTVFNTISEKWLHDAVISIAGVAHHNPGCSIVVYYDTEETMAFIKKHVGNFPSVSFIPDNGWCRSFCERVGASEYYGPAVFGIFRAMQENAGCVCLDTDVFCTGRVELSFTGDIGAYYRQGHPSRCIAAFRKKETLPPVLPTIQKKYAYKDEILFNAIFRGRVSPLQVPSLHHFGQTPYMEKTDRADGKLFTYLLKKIKDGRDVSAALVRKYYCGGKYDCVL